MRLTVFGPGFPLRGGIASTTTALVSALMERGHQVQFLTPQRQYPQWLFPGGQEKDPEACPEVEGAINSFAPLEPWTWPSARKRALDFDADLWIVPYWTWVWAPFWLYLLRGDVGLPDHHRGVDQDRVRRSRPPAVAVVHNLNDHGGGGIQRRMARRVFARCQGFLTHAAVLKKGLEKILPGMAVAAYPLPAILTKKPLPDRETARQRLAVSSEEHLALFLGLIRPYKGVGDLVEAFARLPEDSRWRLVVAGEPWGGLEKVLSDQVVGLGLTDRVELRFGWVPEAEIDQLISAADVLVLPYRSGSQSAVAPMALSRGLPVLATNVGGLPEIIEDGVSGLLVEPNDPEALACALRDLHGEKLAKLSVGASVAASQWTWGGYVGVLEAMVERI